MHTWAHTSTHTLCRSGGLRHPLALRQHTPVHTCISKPQQPPSPSQAWQWTRRQEGCLKGYRERKLPATWSTRSPLISREAVWRRQKGTKDPGGEPESRNIIRSMNSSSGRPTQWVGRPVPSATGGLTQDQRAGGAIPSPPKMPQASRHSARPRHRSNALLWVSARL